MFKKQKKQLILQVAGISFIFAVVAGSLSGVIASVVTNQSFDRYYQSLTEEQEILAISQIKPQALPGTYEEALSNVQKGSEYSLAMLHLSTSDSLLASGWLVNSDFLASGVVITNDGWLLFHSDALKTYSKDQMEIWVNSERYLIDEIIFDTLTDSAMVKITAEDLVSVAFGDSQAIRSGEFVFVTEGSDEILPMNLKTDQMLLQPLTQPAEIFTHNWLLSDEILPAPIFNASAELVAIGSGDRAIPLEYSYAFLQSVLRSGEVQRASINVSTIEMVDVLNMSNEYSQLGAFVVSVGSGPALDAGIQSGDVILGISGRMIDGSQTLSEIITQFEVDDFGYIELIRNGEVLNIEIIFENYLRV